MWGCYEVRARPHARICIKARVIAFKHYLSSLLLLLLLSLVILETGKAFFHASRDGFHYKWAFASSGYGKEA